MRHKKLSASSKVFSAAWHLACVKKCAIFAHAFGKYADELPQGDERDEALQAHRAALCLREYHSIFADLIETADKDPEYRVALAGLFAPKPETLPLFEGAAI